MLSRSDLEALSSHELHDLAMRRALHHGDFGFLWELLREIPAAEAIEGNPARTGADMYRISALITDALGSGEGQTADALRPLYIDYLAKHGDGPIPRMEFKKQRKAVLQRIQDLDGVELVLGEGAGHAGPIVVQGAPPVIGSPFMVFPLVRA